LEQLQLTISLVLYNETVSSIEGLVADINGIGLNKKLYIFDNSPIQTDLSCFHSDTTEVIHCGDNLGYGKGHNVCIQKAVKECSECHLKAGR